MKRILIPISFSKASKNSLKHASTLFNKAHLTLVHIFPTQEYNRRFDFEDNDYSLGILDELRSFYKKNVKRYEQNTVFLTNSGLTSEFVLDRSSRYDLMLMSRKSHNKKKHGYLSEKKLFITTQAKCPVLIMPITDKPFNFKKCSHVWHIRRRRSETKIVQKYIKKLHINHEHVQEKSLLQRNFISSFWENIVQYENTHKKNLLKKVEIAHESEPIDLIILVDNDESMFTRFFKSDTIKLFCKYDIPILVLPTKK